MFRDPLQRVFAGYNDGLHDCEWMRKKFCSSRECSPDPSAANPLDYAHCVENCTINMLMGHHCGDPTDLDVDLAVQKVAELGFVGLTEEWHLSLCLFGTKYAVQIPESATYNVRPGTVERDSDLGSKVNEKLNSWRAENEKRVYKAAVARFWQDIERYGITRDECATRLNASADGSTKLQPVTVSLESIGSSRKST
eukprot:TRINITY_DN39851_c0_g1_i1.p1 TRINITY_DN39851_c0_g1~~TRINITY_DN39851_c0_g1_i1.p1  ORF type:complete len:196 (+),score=26.64 TRINITY_DN39851_c0_g1_i1:501-1088(+)